MAKNQPGRKIPRHAAGPSPSHVPKSPQAHLQGGKVPFAVEEAPYYSRRPAWRIGRLELVDPFGWHQVAREDLDRIRERLSRFEAMTWAEILVEGEKQNHPVPVSQLAKRAQKRLADLRILEERLISLRVVAKERVWGYMAESGILAVLWWDPEHQVCPSPKKNT